MATRIGPSPLSQESLDGSFPCSGPDPGNVLSHDRLRWVFGAPSGTGTGTGTGTNREAFFGLMTRVSKAHVRLPDEVLVQQVAGLPLHADPPNLQQVRPVRQGQDLAHFLLHDQHGVALLTHAV